MKNDTPNIVLIMCDDLGYGDTGFNGNKVIQTPHLDTMCSEGARFTHFFAGGISAIKPINIKINSN